MRSSLGSLLALLSSLVPLGAAAQSVRVRAVEAETGRPVPGAIVVLLDSLNRPVARGLTNESGRLVLSASNAGTFWLRADRIGHPGVSTEPFAVSGTVSQAVIMPLTRLVLPELTSESASLCEARRDNEDVAHLWQEIQKGLASSELSAEAMNLPVTVRTFRRYRTLAGTLRVDTTLTQVDTTGWLFVGAEPAALSEGGFIHERDGRFRFFAPDARVLLSSRFLDDHCLGLAAASDEHPALAGLAFRPVASRKAPDIKGTLWVDRESAELRHVEFAYVNAPRAVRHDGIGGRIVFQRLPNGAWMVSDWYIRMPERVRPSRWFTPHLDPGRDTVVGLIDEGGEVRLRGDVTAALREVAPRVSLRTTILRTLSGRVQSPEGRAVRDAHVTVLGHDSVTVTDDDGRFVLTELRSGDVRLEISAIGYAPLHARLVLAGDRPSVDTSFVLRPVAQTLAPIEVRAPERTIGKLLDFERRRKAGFGRFLTRADLVPWESAPLSTAIRTLGSVVLLPRSPSCGGGFAVATTRGGRILPCVIVPACPLSLFVDGVRVYDGDGAPPNIDDFLTSRVDAVEIYRGPAETPIEYQGTGTMCGAVLIWTRVSGA